MNLSGAKPSILSILLRIAPAYFDQLLGHTRYELSFSFYPFKHTRIQTLKNNDMSGQ